MQVLILGSGVIGTTIAYYLAKAGHEVTVLDRQRGAGAGNQLCQCGRGVARLLGAVGRARACRSRPIKWLLMRHSPLVIKPMLDPAMWRWGLRDAVQLHRMRATSSTRAAWCGWPSTAATACSSCAPTPASATTSARSARCSCSARRSSSTARPRTSRSCKAYGVPYQLLDREGCVQYEPALAAVQRQVRRRPAPAGRRDRRLLQVHAGDWRSWPRRAGVRFRFGVDHHRHRARRRAA